MGWLRCRINFSLLRSAITCLLALPLVTQSARPKFRTLTLTLSLVKPWFQLIRVLACASIFSCLPKYFSRSLFYSNFKVQGTTFYYIFILFKCILLGTLELKCAVEVSINQLHTSELNCRFFILCIKISA